ncbi:nuclease-related domain-containing protein [Mycoplasma phocoenae]|uniref:NERD domain-containing protein n=1 Tax=Mycoplasma phocoenae TaxID=754517 RepID=A0A858U7G5_9MOLU|nr:nuclease-related domain-containing protein [Mycoplasma phocoenae]QJG67163.1 NERD domain-containing protein [Mycoplasma phocoenae]
MNEDIIKNGLVAGLVLFTLSVVAVIVLVLYLKYTKAKRIERGREFETEFSLYLNNWAVQNHCHYIPANLFKYDDNLFETDGVLISDKGIIVVELKSIKGNITGDYNSNIWLKEFSETSYEINNSLKQNDKHIQHLANIIGKQVNFYSFVIYESFQNTLQITNVPDYAMIMFDYEFENKFNYFNAQTETIYSEKTLNNIYNTLKRAVTTSSKDKAKFQSYRI